MSTPTYRGEVKNLSRYGILGCVIARKIVPWKVYEDLPGLILKGYVMEPAGLSSVKEGDLRAAEDLLKDELKAEKLNSRSGLGFLIQSPKILNVCVWDKLCPDAIVPNIYYANYGDDWEPKTVEEMGAFCSGEERVYHHENSAWLKYLNSERSNKDKVVYLNDFFVE